MLILFESFSGTFGSCHWVALVYNYQLHMCVFFLAKFLAKHFSFPPLCPNLSPSHPSPLPPHRQRTGKTPFYYSELRKKFVWFGNISQTNSDSFTVRIWTHDESWVTISKRTTATDFVYFCHESLPLTTFANYLTYFEGQRICTKIGSSIFAISNVKHVLKVNYFLNILNLSCYCAKISWCHSRNLSHFLEEPERAKG
jgi:hypothetical protein